MVFNASLLSYDDSLRNTILDYNVDLDPLKAADSLFVWQSIGNYSLTGFEMTLRRNSLKYLVNYYLPSGLFVIVSWVGGQRNWIFSSVEMIIFWPKNFQAGFLIPPEIVPGRMTLLVTIFLVLINIFNNVTSNSPNVEGLTAISSKIGEVSHMVTWVTTLFILSLDHHLHPLRVWRLGWLRRAPAQEKQTHEEWSHQRKVKSNCFCCRLMCIAVIAHIAHCNKILS